MQHTLGAAVEKVVSKPSPFGRCLVELSRPITHAGVLHHQEALERIAVRPRTKAPRVAMHCAENYECIASVIRLNRDALSRGHPCAAD
jgi:hypothetical protein